MLSRILAILMIVGSVVINNQNAQAQDQVAPEIRFVAAGIQNSRQQIQCVRAVVNYYQFTPKELYDKMRQVLPSLKRPVPNGFERNLPSQDMERNQMATWFLSETTLAMSVEADPKSIGLRYERLVSNEQAARVLQAQEDPARRELGMYYSGVVISPDKVLKDGLWHSNRFYDPRYYVYFYFERTLDSLLLDKNVSTVFKGEENIDGSRCMKIEATIANGDQLMVWVDVGHGFIIRRAEERRPRQGKMVLKVEVKTVNLVEDKGIWLPAVVERKEYLAVDKKDNETVENNQPPTILKRLTLSGFKADCKLPLEASILDWPVGTVVTDYISNRKYAVVASDKYQKKGSENDKPAALTTPVTPKP